MTESESVKLSNILVKYIPGRPVEPQSGASMWIDLDEREMFKSRLLQPERLTAGPGAYLQRGKGVGHGGSST